MSTIPPYLYAAYSIKDQESDARKVIASVVVEEMLHLALTTNLLLALGGEPDFGRGLSPPTRPPAHHKPDLPRTRAARPADRTPWRSSDPRPAAPPEPDEYETLGRSIRPRRGAAPFVGHDRLFDHQPDRHGRSLLYGPVARRATAHLYIHDLDSATRALRSSSTRKRVGDEMG
jgi:hypothetical protein